MLTRPSPSDTTVRTFSISAGLAASTVTPGSTAPEVSLTRPAIALCDCACAGLVRRREQRTATTVAPSGPTRTIVASLRSSRNDTPTGYLDREYIPPPRKVNTGVRARYTPAQFTRDRFTSGYA